MYGRALRWPPCSAMRASSDSSSADEPMSIDVPAAAIALVGPVDQVAVTTPTIAALAGGDLVLQPRRSALEPGHDVLGRGLDERRVDLAAAPHTGGPIAVEDQLETSTSAWRSHSRHDGGRGTPRPRSLVRGTRRPYGGGVPPLFVHEGHGQGSRRTPPAGGMSPGRAFSTSAVVRAGTPTNSVGGVRRSRRRHQSDVHRRCARRRPAGRDLRATRRRAMTFNASSTSCCRSVRVRSA